MRKIYILFFALTFAAMAGCGGASVDEYYSEAAPCSPVPITSGDVRVMQSADADLACQVTLNGTEVSVWDESGKKVTLEEVQSESVSISGDATAIMKPLKLTLVATVSPPVLNGEELGATDVVKDGDYAYVTYNRRGDDFAGGVQVIDVKDTKRPRLISQFVFKNTDVHTAIIDGKDMYLGESVDVYDPEFIGIFTSEKPAAYEHVTLDGSYKYQEAEGPKPLPSYATTGFALNKSNLYMTVGASGGGLVIRDLDTDPGDEILPLTLPIDDARSLTLSTNKHELVIFAGKSESDEAKVVVVNTDDNSIIMEFKVGGATIPDSKSTIELYQNFAFIGDGDDGMKVADWTTGEVLTSVPNPRVEGLTDDLTVANAVTLYGHDYAFISNGEAGIRAAAIKEFLQGKTGVISVVGTLSFDKQESANAIKVYDKLLFVAAGSGGLKIVEFR